MPMTVPDLGPAIIGFGGVLVGSVISTGANWLLVVRKERADQRKETLARANELKTAARLIHGDLALLGAAIDATIRVKIWPSQANEFPMTEWNKHKEVLASELKNEDWNWILVSVLTVPQLRLLPTGVPIENEQLDTLRRINAVIDRGMHVLAPYAASKN
jgi:hypothetical protein